MAGKIWAEASRALGIRPLAFGVRLSCFAFGTISVPKAERRAPKAYGLSHLQPQSPVCRTKYRTLFACVNMEKEEQYYAKK